MGGFFGFRARAAAVLLAAYCLAGAHGDAGLGAQAGRRLLAGPASAPAPATAAAPALAVSSEVKTLAAPEVQVPTAAPAVHVLAPALVVLPVAPALLAPPVAPAPLAAQVVATEAPSAVASSSAPAPGPAAAATQSREYAAAELLKQPPGPGAPTAPTAPAKQPKQPQKESFLRRLAPVLASGPTRGVRAPFATSITGEGGPPVGATPVGAMGTSTLTLTSLTDVDHDAVCNDGSPAGYYFAPGTGEGANLWLVYLEGSMFCWDETSCNLRLSSHPFYMSSLSWETELAQGGIFGTGNGPTNGVSPWGIANRVYIKYCTSDLWSGDVAAGASNFNFAFRGAHIVPATITSLMATKGLGATAGQRMLFGGCSAGAIGAMNNLETVANMLPPTVQLRGFFDGAALLDIQPRGWDWSPDLESLQSLMAEMLAITRPVFPSYCETSFPGNLWKCLIGQYRMPLITSVPYFSNMPQFDMFNIMYDTDNYLPVSKSQLSFVEEFQSGILALIAALPPGTGVFSPTCLVHCLSGQTKNGQTPFTQLETAGTTLSAALSAWYFQGDAVHAVGDCIGWDCINACGVDLRTGLPCMTNQPMSLAGETCSQISVMVADKGATTSTDTSGEADLKNVPAQMEVAQATAAENQLGFIAAQEAAIVAETEASLSSEQQSNMAHLLALGPQDTA